MAHEQEKLHTVQLRQAEFMRLADYIQQKFGIHLPPVKKNLVEGRLYRVFQSLGIQTVDEYFQYLLQDKTGKADAVLVNAISTNHTFFMREADHFRYYADVVLPYLSQQIKDYDLRTWCAACSSGEESYTLAMLIHDHFALQEQQWNTDLLATDISLKVLSQARNGIYEKKGLVDLPPHWQRIYFRKLDAEHYQVTPELKQQVIYRQFNLMNEHFPFKRRFHTIFCRNVMIYFDAPTRERLIQRFYQWLEPQGYLFIGHSEVIERSKHLFTYVRPSVYRKG